MARRILNCISNRFDGCAGVGRFLVLPDTTDRSVMREAFLFPPANDALASQWTTHRRDHSALSLATGSVEVQHDPVIRAPGFMGSCGVRKQRRIVSIAALSVQHRQPRLPFGIEAAWRN
jgi:hypothetical protein